MGPRGASLALCAGEQPAKPSPEEPAAAGAAGSSRLKTTNKPCEITFAPWGFRKERGRVFLLRFGSVSETPTCFVWKENPGRKGTKNSAFGEIFFP